MSKNEALGGVAGRAATVLPETKDGPEKRKDETNDASPGAKEDRKSAEDQDKPA